MFTFLCLFFMSSKKNQKIFSLTEIDLKKKLFESDNFRNEAKRHKKAL